MGVILQFAAIPIDETGWTDILGRSAVIIRLLEAYSPESRLKNKLLWRRIFFILIGHMHSLVHLSSTSAPDGVELPINLSKSEPRCDPWLEGPSEISNLPTLVKVSCGYKIDEMIGLQVPPTITPVRLVPLPATSVTWNTETVRVISHTISA